MGGSSGFYDDACIWFGVSVRAGGAHRNIDSLLRMRHPAFFMVLSRLMDTPFCKKEEEKKRFQITSVYWEGQRQVPSRV